MTGPTATSCRSRRPCLPRCWECTDRQLQTPCENSKRPAWLPPVNDRSWCSIEKLSCKRRANATNWSVSGLAFIFRKLTRNSPKKVALPVIYITDTPSMSDHNREGMEVGHNVKRQTFRP